METVFTAKFSARDSVANNHEERYNNGSMSNYYDGRNDYNRPSKYIYQPNRASSIGRNGYGNSYAGSTYTRPLSRPNVRRNLVQSAIETTSVIGNKTIVNGVLVNSELPGASNMANGTQFSFEINYPENSNINNNNSNSSYQPYTPRASIGKGPVKFQDEMPNRYHDVPQQPVRNLTIERNGINNIIPDTISSRATNGHSEHQTNLAKQNSIELDEFSERSDDDLVKTQTIVVIEKDPVTNKINHIKEAFRLDNNMDNLEYDQISEYNSKYDGQNQPVININETIKFNRIPSDQSRARSNSRGKDVSSSSFQRSTSSNGYDDPNSRVSFRKQLFESTIETTSVLNNATTVVEAPFRNYK